MKEVILTREQLVAYICDSYDLALQGFKTIQSHEAACQTIKELVGEKMFKEIVQDVLDKWAAAENNK